MRHTGEFARQLREQRELTIRPLQTALDHRSREAEALAAKLDEQRSIAADLNASVERLARESAELAGTFGEKQIEADKFLADLVLSTRAAEELRRSVSARDLAADRLRKRVLELERSAAGQSAECASVIRGRTRFPLPPVPWRQFATDLFTGQPTTSRALLHDRFRKSHWLCRSPRLLCDCSGCSKVAGGVEDWRSPSDVCRSADVAAVRQTIESVLAQDYPRLDYIVAPVGDPARHRAFVVGLLRKPLEAHDGRIGRTIRGDRAGVRHQRRRCGRLARARRSSRARRNAKRRRVFPGPSARRPRCSTIRPTSADGV